MWLLVVWVSMLVLALTLYFRQKYSFYRKRGVKTIQVVPPFGTVANFVLGRENIFEHTIKSYLAFPEERFYGSFEIFHPMLLVRDPELIKKITVTDFDHFLDHRIMLSHDTDPLFERNLFCLQGQEWKDMRSTLSPAFTSAKIKHMMPFMVDIGNQTVVSLKKKLEQDSLPYLDVDLKDLVTRFGNDVIASCAFGLKVDSYSDPDNDFYAHTNVASSTFGFKYFLIFILFGAFPKILDLYKSPVLFKSTCQFFRKLVQDTMRERERRNIIRLDMVHLLMEAKKGKLKHDEKTQDADTGFATAEESTVGKKTVNRVWSDDDLTAQAVIFFIAGFETASSATSFLLYEIATNPDVQERLVKEIKEFDAKNNGQIDFTTIQQMKYMDMVVSETLRLWTSALVMDRLCVKDYNLGKPNDKATEDYIIRKGENLQIPIFALHRDPKFFPNPSKFDPERFSDENKHKIKPLSYVPFGYGPRNCLGSRFALVQMKILTYQLLRDMEISPAPKTCIPPELETMTFNLRMKGGLWLRFKSRL